MARIAIILAQNEDLHADAVVDNYAKVGLETFRSSPAQLASQGSGISFVIDPSAKSWCIKSHKHTIKSAEDYAIYCRDWDLPTIASVDNIEYSVAIEETAAFLHAWADMLPAEKCLDHPFAQRRYENKIAQIPLALKAGLNVPLAIAGNDPVIAREFLKVHQSVVKLMSNVSFTGLEGQGEFIYTSRIEKHHEMLLEEIHNCPVLIQEFIKKIADVRVTVVGSKMFSAVMYPENSNEAAADFRARLNKKAEPFGLPKKMMLAIEKFISLMDIKFAAIDFGLKEDGKLSFLKPI